MDIRKILQTAEQQMQKWQIHSASVAVVKDGEVLYSGALGMRDGAGQPADGQTLYPIASCTKAFTVAALARLATQGKFDFDRPVREYLPGFRMADEYATANLTGRDFLSHRSGLPRHEYAWYGSGYTRKQLMDNLRYLPLNLPIRYEFQYSNYNYLIAGEVIEQITGMQFEDYLVKELLQPLGMTRSTVSGDIFHADPNRAYAFNHEEEYTMGPVHQVPYYTSFVEDENPGEGDPVGAAGCIISCADDMAKWLKLLLSGGKIGDGEFIRKDLMDLIVAPHIYMGDGGAYGPERSSQSYGLGWMLYDYRGCRMVEHGGNINGFSASTAWVPSRNFGVFVDAALETRLFADALVHTLVDADLAEETTDWYERLYKANEDMFSGVLEFFRNFAGKPVPDTEPSHSIADYAGTYEVPGYRRLLVTEQDGKLTLDFNHWIVGLRHYHYDTFATEGPIGELPTGLTVTFGTDSTGTVRTASVMLGRAKNLGPVCFTRK